MIKLQKCLIITKRDSREPDIYIRNSVYQLVQGKHETGRSGIGENVSLNTIYSRCTLIYIFRESLINQLHHPIQGAFKS